MRIPLDRGLTTPLYQQIEHYLQQSIMAGTLPAQTRLPATRQLAQALGVSRITVENAYADLESAGLIARRAGSGTYVLPLGQPAALPPGGAPDWPLWQRSASVEAEPMPEAAAPSAPGLIAFTGFGDPRQFHAQEFYRAVKEVMRRDGSGALELGDARGYEPLRTTVAHILANQGIQVHANSVLITTGSQQALALVTQLLLKPGDTVLVENPTYDRALELFRAEGLELIGCPTDALGMQVELLEPLLQQHHPKLIYTVPNFQNPTGTCLSLPRRQHLLTLAERYNVPILEDDFAGELRFEGRSLPALKALDVGGNVIYIGTFSKLLMPGLRVGFLVAEGPILELLAQRKRVNDLVTSSLTQRALEVYVTVGRFQAHVRRASGVYRKRRDVMLAALNHHLPGTRVLKPHGGLFVWVELPEAVSADDLLPIAVREGVSFAPGSRFFVQQGAGRRHVRLNFATQSPDAIETGVLRLEQSIRKLRSRA